MKKTNVKQLGNPSISALDQLVAEHSRMGIQTPQIKECESYLKTYLESMRQDEQAGRDLNELVNKILFDGEELVQFRLFVQSLLSKNLLDLKILEDIMREYSYAVQYWSKSDHQYAKSKVAELVRLRNLIYEYYQNSPLNQEVERTREVVQLEIENQMPK
jgi:hypothetical protein